MKRTLSQNNAQYRYLRLVAEQMADAGLDMRKIIRVPIRPTMENVKALMWDEVMTALYPEIESTTELSTAQMSQLYEVFNQLLGEKWGIHVPWPSEEEQ